MGIVDRRLIGRDLGRQLLHGRALGVGLLLGRELAQLRVAVQVQIRVGEVGFVLGLLGLGLVERSLIGPGIDLDEQITLLDHLAFLEGNLVDLAIDPCSHRHGIEALYRSEPGQVDRKVGLLDRSDGNADGGSFFLRCGLGSSLVGAMSLPAIIAGPGSHRDQHNPRNSPRFTHDGP